MAAEKFAFPDEKGQDGPGKIEIVAEGDVKIDVVDDTPPDDRGREPMPEKIVEELDSDDLEEYSDKVKQRMKALKKVWHDERRAKEANAREREAAVRYAEQIHKENQALKERMGQGEKIFIKEVGEAAKTQLEAAREKLKAAYESGDAGAIATAAEGLQDAKLRQREVEGFRPTRQEPESGVEQPPRTPAPQAPAPEPKAVAWREKNGWFGSEPDMTALALGLHERLAKEKGDAFIGTDLYFKEIDKTMKKRFPEYFSDESADPPEPPARKAANVVAPATRSTAPRRIVLTNSEVALAKRLGITPEAYAREKIKQENQNG